MSLPVQLLTTTLAAEGPAPALFGINPASVQQGLFWIPLVPMLAALFNGLFGWRLSKGTSAFIACGAVGVSFLLSLACFCCVYPGEGGTVLYQDVYTWFQAGTLRIDLAYAVDRLSSVLLLVITGVGFLIHVYSISYMHDEREVNFARYFAYLNLFVGMMLTLVLGANLIVLFVGWEGVGLASYLLIGYWWDDDSKAYAGRKAFVVNRIGDFGFLIGIFTLLSTVGTVDLYSARLAPSGEMAEVSRPLYEKLEAVGAPRGTDPNGAVSQLETKRVADGPFKNAPWSFVLTLAALLLFVGACGKSAQLPLYVWLPDAMAGPTPVSALIHAATMVTAGVYMMCRVNYIVANAPVAMMVIALVGVLTALFAAIIGTQQNDIKKVLAYSTVSQLGYMVLGCGIGAFWAGSLHLLTHAFFKACLFLGAGSVMHAMANETNIWKLGGLRKDIPLTHWTFLTGTVAITGVFPLSGFFSKDAILDLAHHAHFPGAENFGLLLYVLGTIAAGCTAFYMFRAYFLTFWGERRSLKDHHAHEASLMTYPLVVLAFLSIVAAYLGIPQGGTAPWEHYLEEILMPGRQAMAAHHMLENESGLPIVAWVIAWFVALAGFGIAYWQYMMKPIEATDLASTQAVGNPLAEAVRHKFYVDEAYDLVIVRPVKWLAYTLWNIVDQLLIDRVLVGIWGFLTEAFAGILRAFQNGSAQRYAAVMAISIAVILAFTARGFLTQLLGH